MIFVISIIVILFIESIFCLFMQSHDTRQVFSQRTNQNEKEAVLTEEKKTRKSIIIIMLFKFAVDFTFLFSKIVGFIPFHFIRNLFYKYIFHIRVGKRVVIHYGLEVRYPWNITIGDGTIIGNSVIMDARYGIAIGKNVNISTAAWFWTLEHDINSRTFSTNDKGGAITIGDRAWISSRSTILPKCQIGEGCVVAAGAMVTKDCSQKFGIYAGVPAKLIGERNNNIDYEFDGKHRWFL